VDAVGVGLGEIVDFEFGRHAGVIRENRGKDLSLLLPEEGG
jgi:hypothetical protein